MHPASPTRDRAFVSYHPPPPGDRSLRLAVKDLIDVRGEVTTAGSEYLAKNGVPAARDAACLSGARQRGVRIVGKTNVTEFAVTVSGANAYFGTPKNKLENGLIPGGSSSGSAVAVADGMADVAFGTDTAGSIRVPAACCGVVGLKTTFGLVPTKGVFPISPDHLDTVGPMARDVRRTVTGMDLLKPGFAAQYHAAVAAKPAGRQIRAGRLYVPGTDAEVDRSIDAALKAAGFRVVKIDERFLDLWKQAEKDGLSIAMADAWRHDSKYSDQRGVGFVTKAVIALGKIEHDLHYDAAVKRKRAWQRALDRALRRVDFIALPTLQKPTPKLPAWRRNALFELGVLSSQNTVAVNFAGVPAVALPVPLLGEKPPVPVTSLQLIGKKNSEASLLNAARIVESKIEPSVKRMGHDAPGDATP